MIFKMTEFYSFFGQKTPNISTGYWIFGKNMHLGVDKIFFYVV